MKNSCIQEEKLSLEVNIKFIWDPLKMHEGDLHIQHSMGNLKIT